MRIPCLLLLLCCFALPCAAADREKPQVSISLGHAFPEGPYQPGLAGSLDIGKSTSLFVGFGQGTVNSVQNLEPSGTVGLTVRF